MKKYTPYIFPLIVCCIVFLLVFRWYTLRTEKSQYSLLGEGVEIENLSQEEMVNSIRGVGDYESVELEAEKPEFEGTIRYEVKDEKVRFSLMASLPEPMGEYHVWLKSEDGSAMRKVFTLVAGKGGYIGSAALPEELFPVEIIVSESEDPAQADSVSVLRGMITIESDGSEGETTQQESE